MELSHLGARTVIYWFLSLLILFLSLSMSFSENNPTDLARLDLNPLIDVPPKFLYRSENTFTALVIGELKLNIDIENLQSDISQYNLIGISNLEYQTNTNITLNWKVDSIENQIPINLNKHSKTPIRFKTSDSSKISDLHLIISQEKVLGVEHGFQDEVSFQSIYLDHQNNHNNLMRHLSQWTGFNPISFSSINSYSDNNNLIYQSLIIRLSIWLICSILLFLIINIPVKHLFSIVFIAWIIPTTIDLNNRFKQHKQIKASFLSTSSLLNSIDKNAFELSQNIKSKLIELDAPPSINNKLIVIGKLDFFNLRLINHLNDYSISVDYRLRKMMEITQLKNAFFLLTNNNKKYCDNLSTYPKLRNLAEITFNDSNFCIMRKIQ